MHVVYVSIILSALIYGFEATEEWQIVEDGDTVPPGLHIRMNLETGIKQAKLMGHDDDTNESSQIIVLEQETENKSADIEPEIDYSERSFSSRPYVKPNWRISRSEHAVFNDAITVLTSSTAPESILVDKLQILEDSAHEIEFGLRLSEPTPLTSLMRLMSTSRNESLRELSATVIGSAVQNNAPALEQASSFHLVFKLLTALEKEERPKVQRRIVYALSAAIHHIRALREYDNIEGGLILRNLPHDDALVGKIAVFVEDTFANKAMNKEASDLSMLDQGNMVQHKLTSEDLKSWCAYFSRQSLLSTEARWKVDSAMRQLHCL